MANFQFSLDRKKFLKLMALGGTSFLGMNQFSGAASKICGPHVSWGRLKFLCEGGNTDDWNVHPNGDLNLIEHVVGNTTVNIENKWNVASVDKITDMSVFPLLFMHSEREPDLDDVARANLREYMLRGGFLFAEDCVIGKQGHGGSQKNDFFFRKMIEEFPKIMPEAKIEKLTNDHPIFHSFYDLPNGLPHMQGTEHGAHGLILDGRLVAFLSPSDNHCGWTNGYVWFGEKKQQAALQMGTNLYVYAMTQTAKQIRATASEES